MRKNKKVYWIDVNDIQEIAEQDLNRKLTDEELEKVIDKMGNYINWADGISLAFDVLKLEKAEEEDE